ncbi:MAG: universal stress protein [Phycisphaerae bacterium]|jgi:nucleotide-binding universal stress UspA family protein|nr:universal stress protein [Phycisphaerae bacterium]
MTLNPKRVLWPTDFSNLSMMGANYAKALRDQFGSELHVIHVIPPLLGPELPATIPPELPPLINDPNLLATTRENLQKTVRELFGDDHGVVVEVFFGHAWDGVCDYAKRREIDLIIVPTHGRTGLAHVLIGSTAEKIVQHAPCAVLVVKQNARQIA